MTIIVYRLVFSVVGLGSYVPYLALLVMLHLVVAAEVFVLVRRAAGPVLGLAAGVLMLFFGSGFEDLYWAMQIGFIGAAALGFGAMVALEGSPNRAHAVLATGLLVAAVSTSGLGLVMVAAVGLELAVDRGRRQLIAVAIVPAAIYVAWYLMLGRYGVATVRDPFTLQALAQVPGFVIEGAGAAAGSISGLGPALGIGLIVGVLSLAAWRLVRGRGVPARTVGCLGGILVLYVLTGLVRAQLGVDAALYSRYLYLSGPLLLVALGALIGPDVRSLRLTPRTRLIAVAGGAALMALALTWNVRLLVEGRDLFVARAALSRALVAVSLEPTPPAVNTERQLILVPSPASLRRIVAAHGSPLEDPFVIGGTPAVSTDLLAEANRRMREGLGSIGPLPQ